MPDDLVIATLEVPEAIPMAPAPTLPSDWRGYPAPASLRRIGDRFIAEGKFACMLVPSVLVPHEDNVMLNPAHSDTVRMVRRHRLAPFFFDPRLLV
jgi:RES domain-containing protein